MKKYFHHNADQSGTLTDIVSVLIVDDRIENLIAAEAVLKRKDYKIERALSGKEAIEKALINDYDCILLDVQMPEMDGFEVAEFLSSNEKTRDIPIIFLTALSTEKQFMLKGYKTGAVEYLSKPVDSDILKVKVETFAQINKQKKLIKQAQAELHKSNNSLQAYTNEITSSIRYAKNIQNAILPKDEIIKAVFPESFIYYKPCHIVGGDFYWFTIKNGKAILACIDCTGHGVPGALMSMIGSNMIKNIVEDKNITEPAAILNEMNRKLKTTFNHNNIGGKIVDGMEAAICSFDLISGILEFSGAKRPLMLVKKETHEVIKPDSQSISHETPPEFRFTNHIVNLEEDDYIYMFTDGYTDQFGGENGKRFMKSKFIDLINSVREIDMNEQSFYVQQTFETWKGENEQVDDVLVMGFKFK
jgi:serine phosphatase RsbU (regulator of sigma subunit)